MVSFPKKSMQHDKKKSAWNIIQAILFFFISLNCYILVVNANSQQLWSMGDLGVYVFGAQLIQHSHNLYQIARPFHLPFTYPPIAALLFSTILSIPFNTLKFISASITIISLIISIWISWSMLGYRSFIRKAAMTLFVAGITLWLEPVQQTLLYGQINLLLMAIILMDMSQPDKNIWKGFGIGLATGIKLTPAIFILYLLLTRRYQATIVAICIFVMTLSIGYILLPIESNQYWHGLFLDASRVGGVAFVSNQSLHGTITRLLHGTAQAVLPWLISILLVSISGLSLAVWAHNRREELLGILTCAITGLLVSPISWSHHWVWVVPIVVYMIHLNKNRLSILGWLGITGFIAIYGAWFMQVNQSYYPSGLIWFVPNLNNREYYWQGFQQIEGNLYVIVGVSLLLIFAIYVLKNRNFKEKLK